MQNNEASLVRTQNEKEAPQLKSIPHFSSEKFSEKISSLGFLPTENCYIDEHGMQTCEWNFDLETSTGNYNITMFGRNKTAIEQVEILGAYQQNINRRQSTCLIWSLQLITPIQTLKKRFHG